MAQLLAQEITTIPGVQLLFPVQANAVFAELPLPAIQALLARGWLFYTFIGQGGVRLMCSWDTTAESVLALAQDLRAVMTA